MQPGCFTLQTNEFLPEVNGSWDGFPRFAGIHMSPVYFASAQANLNTAKAIIDLWPYLFQNDGTVHPSIATELDTLGKQYLDANLGKIFAFYIMDEPTGHNISKTSMEAAIAAVKTRFPGIPTYSIYAQDCFDNASSLDAKCGMAGKRGVPSNLDWVGFDWYMPSDTSNDTTVFKTQITDTVTRLKSLTTKPIILVPDVTDQMLQSLAVNWRDYWLSERFKRYAALMRLDTQVKGIDAYAWVQHGNACSTTGTTISGARYWPSVRTALYQESIK
ncbi:MAG: hypothetical protein WBK28_03770 [Minisyncoccia bacterium]